MENITLIASSTMGLESIVRDECVELGFKNVKTFNGRVEFDGTVRDIPKANIHLRCADRVFIKMGEFKAFTFDELFRNIKKIDWQNYIPENGEFPVSWVSSVKSKLFSKSDIQRITKKAIVEKLKMEYHESWFAEDGAEYPIRVFFYKDEAIIALDTSGESLHKRGYRKNTSKAPISETLATALIMLTPWNKDRILVDPFCGCGTFPIEAAMIAANIAPGMNREFTAENWTNFIDKKLWYKAVNEAYDIMNEDVYTDIQGYDIDPEALKSARANAKMAGVDKLIHFQQRAVQDLRHPKKYGFIITNPPYGERLEDKADPPELYTQIGQAYQRLDSWSMFLITSYTDTEKYIGRKADKNRKIYNGMMKTYFYQFMGPKPPKPKKTVE